MTTMNDDTKLFHAKEALYRAAYLASIGENDPKKIQNAYRLILDAIDLISDTENKDAA